MIKIKSNEVGAKFGNSVAISGEYAVAGSPKSNKEAVNGGLISIYKKNDGEWIFQQTLKSSDIASYDLFGSSIAIDGSYIVAGAYAHDDLISNSGAVYIFKNNNGIWSEIKKITASDAGENDYFGYSVAISGDYVIVGAYGNDNKGYDSGAAYVFKNSGDTWEEVAKLTASDKAEKDLFGYSVSISGEFAIVGAYQNDIKGSNSGSAYIFQNLADTWSETQILVPDKAVIEDNFGYSVGISGTNAIIGSPGRDSTNTIIETGRAYIYKYSSGTWTEEIALQEENPATYNRFGASVFIADNTAITASINDDERGEDAGVAYVFNNNSGTWKETKKIMASDAGVDDKFGFSVGLIEDYAIVGAYQENAGGEDAGAIYIYTSKLAISVQPKDTTVCQGTSYSFAIKTTGVEAYKWEIDSTGSGFLPITDNNVFINSTSFALNILSVTGKMDGYKFRCVVTGGLNSKTSNVATLHTIDVISPEITCPDDIKIANIPEQKEYEITTNEYDFLYSSDNCQLISTINNINSLSTLKGVTIPKGITSIKWTATDKSGNTGSCSYNITYLDANSIPVLSKSTFNIYPNPVKNNIFIEINDNYSYSLIIYDITGEKIYSQILQGKTNKIPVKKFAKGIYFVELTNEKGIFTEKIIIK